MNLFFFLFNVIKYSIISIVNYAVSFIDPFINGRPLAASGSSSSTTSSNGTPSHSYKGNF